MVEPKEYRIVRALQTIFRGISTARGYHHDVANLAVKLNPNISTESVVTSMAKQGMRPFILLEVKSDSEIWTYQPSQTLDLVLPMTVHWVNDTEPTKDESHTKRFFEGCADVEQAVGADIQLGGLAFSTRIVKRRFDLIPDSTLLWAMVDLTVHIHRTFGLPN